MLVYGSDKFLHYSFFLWPQITKKIKTKLKERKKNLYCEILNMRVMQFDTVKKLPDYICVVAISL